MRSNLCQGFLDFYFLFYYLFIFYDVDYLRWRTPPENIEFCPVGAFGYVRFFIAQRPFYCYCFLQNDFSMN